MLDVASIVHDNSAPWDGVGSNLLSTKSTDDWLNDTGLNWEVEKVIPEYYWKGQKFIDDQQRFLIRSSDGRKLSTVSRDWEPVQNKEAFDFFRDFVDTGKMTMEAAGELKDGNIIWALAKTSKEMYVFRDDRIDNFILFTLPHQYGKTIDVRHTPLRIQCGNILTFALSRQGDLSFKMNHRRKFDATIVKETLGIADDRMAKYKEIAEFLGGRKYTKELVVEYFKSLFPSMGENEDKTSRAAKLCESVLETQPGHTVQTGSWWQAFNSVTYVLDHHLGRNQNNRLYSAWYGPNRNIKLKALDLAVTEYANR